MSYAAEFAKVAAAHLLAVASPGPDFAIVLRQSLLHGRRSAIWTSIGVGCGISFHVAYSLLGVGLLLMKSPTAVVIFKYAGAAYLTWLGLQALRTRPRPAEPPPVRPSDHPVVRPSAPKAWTLGFLTNALNPKATLFFLALFPVVISSQTPLLIRAGYGVWLVLATMAWFSLVSVLFTAERVRTAFLRQRHWIDRALGVVFLAFALGLLFARQS